MENYLEVFRCYFYLNEKVVAHGTPLFALELR